MVFDVTSEAKDLTSVDLFVFKTYARFVVSAVHYVLL